MANENLTSDVLEDLANRLGRIEDVLEDILERLNNLGTDSPDYSIFQAPD